jgi:hypothetical protein
MSTFIKINSLGIYCRSSKKLVKIYKYNLLEINNLQDRKDEI